MKRLFSLFSMLMLLSSNALPVFTYAESWANELAIQILTEEVNNVWELFNNENNIELVQWNDNMSAFSTDSDNPHIVYDEENGLITVYTWDFSYWITIKDKNLGSEVSWTWTESIWNYYRWWYNTPITSTNYSSTSNIDAWGWWYDVLENDGENENIIKWYNKILHKSTNLENRRWPCPENYHIASAWERNELIKLYYNAKWLKNLIEEKTYSLEQWSVVVKSDSEKNFVNDLKFPFPGSRYHNWNVVFTEWSNWWYWTSSPVWGSYTSHARYFYATQNWRLNVTTDYDIRSFTFPIRCFKNDYIRHPKTITYNPNWWAFSWMDVNEIKEYTYNYSWTEIIPIYNIQIPDRISEDMSQQSWWMFAWWYTKDWSNNDWWEEFDPDTSTTNVAYAKWLPFNDLVITMGDKTFTILDRNLWATGYYEVPKSPQWNYDEDTLWIYYQRWNNHWFNWYWNNSENINSNIDTNSKDVNNYWPWNYFYYHKFIINNKSSWHTELNRNLWWGGKLLDKDRQWPCPKWYHIPERREFNGIITEYNKRKDTDEWIEYCNNYDFTSSNFCLATKLQIPIAWTILPNLEIQGKWNYILLWSASTQEYSDTNSRAFYIWDSGIYDNWMSRKVETLPIRCFKDEIKKIEYQTYWWNFESTPTNRATWWWENASILPVPTKNDWLSIFKWWYTTENYEDNTQVTTSHIDSDEETIILYAKWECESWYTLSEDLNACNPNVWTIKSNDWKWNEINIYRYVTNNTFINNWYEFIGWNTQSDWNWTTYKSWDIINESWLVLYAQWKSIEEKAQETTKENVIYTNNTTVTVWDETKEEVLSWSSTLTLVAKEVESHEVTTEEDTTKVQDSEIKVTSDKTVEYEWWLEVYLEKTEEIWTEVKTGKVEWTIKFSAPVAVKIPISSDAEYVKIQVKHWDENFGFKWLTLNPINECNNWEAVNDKYNWEDVSVTWNTNKYATIYTCSASTFVAYTENKKPVEIQPSAWWGRIITSTKNGSKSEDQEHNSANLDKVEDVKSTQTTNKLAIDEQIKKVGWRTLTRWEVAVMTNILLEVYPQLVEWKQELDDVTNACSNYVDEQNFTKDEKKAITRLCKLSIMWIHNDTNEPLEEFLVNNKSTNDEFSKVINRSVEIYNEKDLSTIKDALKKLEWDEESVVFGTVYEVFMGIKNIFSK